MENYNYWIVVYATVFTLLITSLSINSIFFIKDKTNKILAFFVFTGIYSFILSFFFEKASVGYTQQELLPQFIYKGYDAHLFKGTIYLAITFVLLIILIIRIFLKRKS